jgi:ATP-dependent protease Clp ATPase subunit
VMYDIPAATDIECVQITQPVVLGEQAPIIQRKPVKAAA